MCLSFVDNYLMHHHVSHNLSMHIFLKETFVYYVKIKEKEILWKKKFQV